MATIRGHLAYLGVALLAGCTATVHHKHDGDDSDSGTDAGDEAGASNNGGDRSLGGSGGKGSGGKGSGGKSSGGAASGGAAAGGAASGGAAAGGAANTGGSINDSGTEAGPEAGTCSPSDESCDKCIQTKCCAEYLACDDVTCGGDATHSSQLIEFITCMQYYQTVDAGPPSLDACALANAPDGGSLAATTVAVVNCIVDQGDSGPQNCSQACWGAEAVQ